MRMKRATIYLAATLLATGAVATYATTPDQPTTQQTRNLQVAPYAGLSNNKRMLLFMSQAERLVLKGDSTFAKMHINEALSAAARLPSSPDANDNNAVYRMTILTMMDGTHERQLMLVQPSNINDRLRFSSDALPEDGKKITKAEVHYISGNWDKAALLIGLNNVLRFIETGKDNAVTPEFNQLHAQLLDNTEHTVSERRAAQDNISLARTLLQVNAYDAAKLALAKADEHVQHVAKENDDSPKRFEEIATIRNEMADVGKAIERREPATFKLMDAKLEKWRKVLS